MLVPVLLFALAGVAPLKTGDVFPEFSGQTISGRAVILPEAGKQLVAIFSFSRAGGVDARSWRERADKVESYGIIMLASVPRLLRGVVASGIQSGMPPDVRDRTILYYKEEAIWKQRLAVSDDKRAYVVLVDRSGRVLWTNPGPFSESDLAKLLLLSKKLP
jgi:hypothetical protein